MRLCPTAALLALGATAAHAQLSYDGTLSSGSLSGLDYQLLEAQGTLAGGNLFHSFADFNLASGESATFSGSAGIANILARVTGGNLSRIDGTVRSTVPGAHFFLMNPNGILFGPGAALDLRGSFTATTADHIELADGAKFDALPSAADALLTGAAPSAFGFLGDEPAAVEFDRSNLSVGPGESFNVVAGDIALNQSTITARAGAVNLTGRGNSGAGGVVIRGGRLVLDNSRIESQNLTANAAGSIDIEVTGAVEVKAGGGLSSFNMGAGKGADIRVRAAEMSVDGSASGGFTDLFTANFSTGEPGVIELVVAGALSFVDGGSLLASTLGPGAGGAIDVSAGSLLIDGRSSGRLTGVRADTRGAGSGGDVTANIAGALSIRNNGVLSTDTRATGAGGSLDIRAGSVELDGGSSVGDGFFTGITALASEGGGGTVGLDTGALSIRRGARIDASTTGSGAGGRVDVAAGRVEIDGGTSAERTGIVTFTNEGLTGATGDAGDLVVRSRGDLNMDKASITALAGNNGGDIDVTAGEYIRLFGSEIVAEAGNDGGNVTVGGARYALLDDSRISANAVNGTGGAIQIGTEVLLANNSPITASSQFGADGTVRIDAIFDLSGSLAELDDELRDASAQLQPRCSVRNPGESGSFILVGRGGLPVQPGQYLPAQQLLDLPES